MTRYFILGDPYAIAPHLRNRGYEARADGYYLHTNAPLKVIAEMMIQRDPDPKDPASYKA